MENPNDKIDALLREYNQEVSHGLRLLITQSHQNGYNNGSKEHGQQHFASSYNNNYASSSSGKRSRRSTSQSQLHANQDNDAGLPWENTKRYDKREQQEIEWVSTLSMIEQVCCYAIHYSSSNQCTYSTVNIGS